MWVVVFQESVASRVPKLECCFFGFLMTMEMNLFFFWFELKH